MFQPGKAFNKYKPNNNGLKPRKKNFKYSRQKGSKEIPNYSLEGQTSDKLNKNYVNAANVDYYGANNDYSGIDSGNIDAGVIPETLSGPKGSMSAETKKRLKLKQIIQNESDYQTEEK